MSRRAIDLTGVTVGFLTAQRRVDNKKGNAYAQWLCLCKCGKETVVSKQHFGTRVFSCGCWRRERMHQVAYRHGHAGPEHSTMSPEYKTWLSMKNRCLYESNSKYALYGGRGISICAEWMHDFPQFLRDMGEKPSRLHTIDRIDGDGNYEPANCRWATPTEQRRNRRPSLRGSKSGYKP